MSKHNLYTTSKAVSDTAKAVSTTVPQLKAVPGQLSWLGTAMHGMTAPCALKPRFLGFQGHKVRGFKTPKTPAICWVLWVLGVWSQFCLGWGSLRWGNPGNGFELFFAFVSSFLHTFV